MNTNKGFTPIAVALFIVGGIIFIGGAFYGYYQYSKGPVPGVILPVTTSTPSSTVSSSTPTSTSTPVSPTKKFPLYPASGSVGSVVTINGSGFTATGNVVTLNGLSAASLKNLSSADGKTIRFTVPQTLGPVCDKAEMCAQFLMEVTAGNAYQVAVISNMVTQTIGSFTVTGGSAQRSY